MTRWAPALAALALTACQWQPTTGHNVALLYGITVYNANNSGTFNAGDLQYPALDALALAPLLRTGSGGVFATVTTRTNAAATKAQLVADVAAAAAVLDSDSEFLFYYSGHGTQYGGHAYIVPHGAAATNVAYNTTDMVSEDELRDLLATLPTRKVVVILDSCNSGGFLADAASGPVPQDTAAYYSALWKAFLAGRAPGSEAELASWYSDQASLHSQALASWNQALAAGSGFAADRAQLLTAAGALESSYDASVSSGWNHGAFTHFLLAAKDRGDFDGNGYVTVSEAYRYAFNGLQEEWNGVWGAVGAGSFVFGNPTQVFLPHLSSGPADYLLFKN